jgi:hypothetical protein
MKPLLLGLFFFQSFLAFSQDDEFHPGNDKKTYQSTYKIHGYINNIRLDSVDAIYATISAGWGNIYFEFGQPGKIREHKVKDAQGLPLTFENYSDPLLLNFFYYNGWELQKIYQPTSTSNATFLLKKRLP